MRVNPGPLPSLVLGRNPVGIPWASGPSGPWAATSPPSQFPGPQFPGPGLKSANVKRFPTYPSSKPRRHLDFILHSDKIDVHDFQVPQVRYSDHLPLVMDFDVQVEVDRRTVPRKPRRSIQQAVQESILPS